MRGLARDYNSAYRLNQWSVPRGFGKKAAMQALPVLLGVAAGSLGLLYLLVRLLKGRWRRQNLPPERSGWIPWLGCALDFGKAPLFFIQETREKVY